MNILRIFVALMALAPASPAMAAEMGHGAMEQAAGEPKEGIIDFAPDPYPKPKLVTDFPSGLVYVVRSADGEEIFRHVDSTFRVRDPHGNTVVESENVHSHPGVFRITQSFASPGTYTLEVTAKPEHPGKFNPVSETFSFEVHGPAEIGSAALDVSLEHPVAHKLTEVTIAVRDPLTGEGLKHSNFDVLVMRMGQRLLQTRLHTHTGTATFRYRFPSPGSYVVKVTAFPTPEDTQYNYPATTVKRPVAVR